MNYKKFHNAVIKVHWIKTKKIFLDEAILKSGMFSQNLNETIKFSPEVMLMFDLHIYQNLMSK